MYKLALFFQMLVLRRLWFEQLNTRSVQPLQYTSNQHKGVKNVNCENDNPYRTPSLYQYCSSLIPSLIHFPGSTGQVEIRILQVWQVLTKTWITLGNWFQSQNQLFKKFRVKTSNSKKLCNVPRFLHLFLGTFSRAPEKWCKLMPTHCKLMPTDARGTGKIKLGRFQLFLRLL